MIIYYHHSETVPKHSAFLMTFEGLFSSAELCMCMFTVDSWSDEQGAQILQKPRGPGVQRERKTQDQGIH